MIPSLSPLFILVCVPFLAVGATVVGFPALRTAGVASAFNAVLALSLGIVMVAHPAKMKMLEVDYQWASVPGWPSIHCHLALTGLSSLLLVVVTLIGLTAVAKIPERAERPGLFAGILLTLNGGAIGTLLAQDVFEMIFYLSLLIIPPFLLIGKWGGHNRQLGGFQTTVTWGVAIGLIFAAMLGLATLIPHSASGYEWDVIRDSASALGSQKQILLFGLMLAGTGLLIGAIPFHGWLLAGYPAAPVSTVIFMAGVIPCVAFYLLVNWGIDLLPIGFSQWQPWILGLGVANLLYAGILSWELREIRQVMGAVCLCQRGLIFLGLAMPSTFARDGAFLLIIGSALSGACTVGLMAELELYAGDNRIRELASKSMPRLPLLSWSLLCSSGMAIGFPLSLNFIGIYLVLKGIFLVSGPVLVLATLGGISLFSIGLIQTIRVLLFPQQPPPQSVPEEPDPDKPSPKTPPLQLIGEFVPYGLLLLLNLIGGCDPGLFVKIIESSVTLVASGFLP